MLPRNAGGNKCLNTFFTLQASTTSNLLANATSDFPFGLPPFFFFFICACVHRGTEPASNLNLLIWKLADIIPLNFLHQWLLEKPLAVGVKKKKKKLLLRAEC